MEISDENIFDQKLKSEEMNHMMLWRKTISGREKSKNKDNQWEHMYGSLDLLNVSSLDVHPGFWARNQFPHPIHY